MTRSDKSTRASASEAYNPEGPWIRLLMVMGLVLAGLVISFAFMTYWGLVFIIAAVFMVWPWMFEPKSVSVQPTGSRGQEIRSNRRS